MKDRIERTNTKKPSHNLFKVTVIVAVLTIISSIVFSILLFHLSGENKTLNQQINNYEIMIDKLENDDTNLYLKNK